jgi:hypothetical protein
MATSISDKTPGIPYLLYYRQGNNPYPQFFMFYHASPDIRKVVERIKSHCEKMNLRFIHVRPFIVDLDEAEEKVFGKAEIAG